MPKPRVRKRAARQTKGTKADKAFLKWDSNEIPGNIDKMSTFVDKSFRTTLRYYEPQVENYARLNAPWQDQTTNARNGLIAQSGKQGSEYFLVLAHRVPYGIWLEVRFGGKNAIILPTITFFSPKIMGTMNKILDKFHGSGRS